MGITLITPTGNRQETFALCEMYMSRQTYTGDLQWIVVDDGDEPTKCSMGQEYIRASHRRAEGRNTQALNLLLSLDRIKHDKIFVIEDDDWYSSDYLLQISKQLDNRQIHIAADGATRFYFLHNRLYTTFENKTNSALFQTGFRDVLIQSLTEICKSISQSSPDSKKIQDVFIDYCLWSSVGLSHRSISKGNTTTVGIKGFYLTGDGKGNITGLDLRKDSMHHRGIDSEEMTKLRSWIGRDIESYLSYSPPPHS